MFRASASLTVVLLLALGLARPAQAQVPLTALNQNPSIAFLGDIDTAKWIARLGAYALTFGSDHQDTAMITGMSTTTYLGRLYRPKAQFTNHGNLRLSGRVEAHMPAVYLYRSSAQSIPNTTNTSVEWNAEEADEWSMHATSGATEWITFPYDGVWSLEFQGVYAANATGYREGELLNDNGDTLGRDSRVAVNGEDTIVRVVVQRRFTAGEQVRCRVNQTSGAALNLSGSGTFGATTLFTAVMLSS